MSRSLVFAVLLLGSGLGAEAARAAEDSAAGQTVYLKVREPEGYNPSSCAAPLLERELVRQAFLIAARDELGLSTRDVLLREDFPKQPDEKSVPFELYCQVARVKKDFDVEYRLSRGSIDKVIWRWVFNTDINNPKSLNTLTETAELFSRRQLKDVLIRGGWIGTVPSARESSDVPSATQDLLWSWNEVSVMAGLRRVHADIRAKGESPELLAALAVGYVNLGSLTDYYYSAGFKAYYARALLYAERLVRKTNASPWALWHRGYVRLQLGLHNFGAEDIAEARKKQGDAPSAKPLPFWTDVVEAFGQGELSRMLQIAKTPPQRALARYLNLQAVMYGDLVDLKIKTANDLVEQCPDCPRAQNELALSGALGPMRQASYSAFSQTGTFLRKRLLDVPGLPEELAKRLRSSEVNSDEAAEVEFRKSLIASLKHAGAPEVDRGEPSLSALGHALEEIDFAQVMRRLEFEGHALSVSTRETIAVYGPLCEAHPYAAYIDAYTNQRKEIEAAAAVLVTKLELPAVTFKEQSILQWLYSVTPTPRLHDWYQAPQLHSDMTFGDEISGIHAGFAGPPDDRKYNRPYMMKTWNTSNKLPISVALRISRDWAHARQETDVRERDYADDPLVMKALAERYYALKRYDDAERCAKRQVKAAPGYPAYRLLAGVYKAQKDQVRWKQTLDKAIKLPAEGLEQASVQNEIALDLLERKEWKEAVVYADAAAESYSAWSLLTDARCHEMLGDWKKAEQLVQAVSERYNDTFAWMFWCHRTGRGDVRAADEAARARIERWGTALYGPHYRQIAIYYLLTNEPDKAWLLGQRSYENRKDPYVGLHAALIADGLGKTAERDAILKEVIETKLQANYVEAKTQEYYQQLATQLTEMLPPKSAKALNVAEVEKIQTAAADHISSSSLLYFVGVFLKNRGDVENAKKYLLRCAQSNDWRSENHVLACQLLREMKVKLPPAEAAPNSTDVNKAAAKTKPKRS